MHGKSDRNSFSPPWIASKEPLGQQSLAEFGCVAGSFAAKMDQSGVEIGEHPLDRVGKDLRA